MWLQVAVLTAIWAGGLWFAWKPDPVADEEKEIFAFKQSAKATVIQQYVAHQYPDVVKQALRLDVESERRAARKFVDGALEGDALPPEVFPHWALVFHVLGDSEYCAVLLEKGSREGVPGMQIRLVEAMESGEDIPDELAKWVAGRYNEVESQLDLPEWYYLAEYEDNISVQEWMEVRGHRMIRTGALADLSVAFFLVLLLFATFRWFRKGGKTAPHPYASRLVSRWRTPLIWREFLLAEAFALGIGLVAAIVLGALGYLPYLVGAGLIVMLVPTAWLIWRLTPGVRATMRMFGLRRPGWKKSNLFWFGIFGLLPLALIGLVMQLLVEEAVMLPDAIRQDLIDSRFRVFWGFVLAAVLAPVCEEVIFRGFLFGGLAGKIGVKTAAVVASLVFAFLHFYSWQGFVAVFLYGLVFCWLYRRSGSLWPGILAHGVFNFLITAETAAWFSLH